MYEVWCEAVDALGGRALGKKQIDITRSQTTAGGAWTTAVGITVDVATKRTSGIVNGVDFSAELAPDSIGVQFTVTGAASKSLFWKLSIIEGVSATHPDNLVAGLRTS